LGRKYIHKLSNSEEKGELLIELKMYKDVLSLIKKYPKLIIYLKRDPDCPNNIKSKLN
jgi:hypothetical protein